MADLGGLPRSEKESPAPEAAGAVHAPEAAPERPVETETPAQAAEVAQTVERAAREQERIQAAPSPVVTAAPVKDPLIANVERALEEGLQETYLAMTPPERVRFRTAGERAATRIGAMLAGGHLKFKLIWKLIRDWLKTIPGASRFFVEQEAKIKTDRIIHLAEKQKRR